jgi:peptide-methionine (S)-S-oxide reductase
MLAPQGLASHAGPDLFSPGRRRRTAMAQAMFGAGCFWGVEAAFRQLPGVRDTEVGFCGGTVAHPSYEQVASGTTGHAQVVRVDYDPAAISYEALLEVFWRIHDPTQHHRQGPDIGPQYRSVIFALDDAQRRAAEAYREALARSGAHGAPLCTEIVPAGPFYRAEEHHQRYYEKRGEMARSLLGGTPPLRP